MKGKRIISLTAAVLLAVTTFLSVPQMASVAYADNGDPAMSLGPEALQENVNTPDTRVLWYGENSWYVIGYQPGVRASLLSKSNIGSSIYFSNDSSREYGRSNLKIKIDEQANKLSDIEKSSVVTKTLYPGNYDIVHALDTDGVTGGPYEDQLIWPLTTKEAVSVNYTLRKADPEHQNWESSYWWLGSPGSAINNGVAYVEGNGDIDHSGKAPNLAQYGVRPAFYLDLPSVLFTSAATSSAGGKSSSIVGPNALKEVAENSSNEWKVTLKDSSRNFAVSSCTPAEDGVTVTYTGAENGENEFISAIIKDSADRIRYYGRIEQVSEGEESGEITIRAAGKLNEGDTLYVFNEQFNGDKKTDYASELKPVSAAMVTFSDDTDIYSNDGHPVYIYEGDDTKEQHPTVTISRPDGSLLMEGTHYHVTYGKLDGAGEADVRPIKPGSYRMVVFGMGDYDDLIDESKRFEIWESDRPKNSYMFNRNRSESDIEWTTVSLYVGQVIPETSVPSYSNDPYVLEGWYYDRACSEGKKIDLTKPLSEQIETFDELIPGSYYSLYAKWVHEHPLTRVDKKEATCAEAGYEEYWICETCDKLFSDDAGRNEIQGPVEIPIDPDAHVWGEWKVTKEPTETAEGLETRECSGCHKTETRPVPAKGYAPGDDPNQKGTDGTAVGPGASAAAAENAIISMKNDTDPKGSVYSKLKLKSPKQTNTSIKLSWTKVSKAKKYVIYGNKCGKTSKPVKLAAVTGTTKTFNKIKNAKIKKGTYYKFIVVALDKDNNVVSTSKLIHVATKGGKVTNHKSVKVKNAVVNKAKKLKKGKTLKLAPTTVKQDKKLKVSKHVGIRYESTNKNVATVSKKGVVKGMNKGTAYVYAYAQSGVSKKVKVVVK